MPPVFHAAIALALCAPLAAAAAEPRPTVGLLLKVHSSEGFWGEIERGAREGAEAAGVELIIKGTADSANSAAQIKLLESLAKQKVDALIISPVSAERLLAPLQAQAANGLRIVIAESEFPSNTPWPFVGYDQTKLAVAAANAFAALLHDGDEVALFRSLSDQVVVQRDKTILARLKELRPNLGLRLDFFAVTTELSSVADKAALLLQKYPDAKMVIATSSPATSILLATAKNRAVAGPAKIAGFGFRLTEEAEEAIESGLMPAYVCQAPREIGFKSVTTAAALIRGTPVSPRTDITFFVVTKSNLHDPAIQALKSPK